MAEFDEGRDDDLVVVEGGHAKAELHDLDALVVELLVEVGVVAHREVGLGEAGLGHGLQHEEREVVDRVLLVRGLAADGDVLVHGAAGGGEGVRLAAHLVDGERLDPEAGEELERLVARDGAGLDVRLVVREHVLVEAAVGEAVAVGLDLQDELDEPDGLHGLAEGAGGLVGHAVAGLGDLAQLGGARLVLLGLRHLAGERGVASGKAAHRGDHHEDGLVEDVLVDGVRVGEVEGGPARADALLVAGKAVGEHALVVDCQVGVAGVELALHAKEAGLHVDLDLVGQKRLPTGAQVVVLPEGREVTELLLGLLGDVEGVAVALLEGVKLVQDELHRVLGEDGGVPVLGGLVARDEGLVLDVDRHVVEDVLEHERALHHVGLVLVGAIGLGGQHRALGVDVGLLVEHLLAERLHAGRELSEVAAVGLGHLRLPFSWDAS